MEQKRTLPCCDAMNSSEEHIVSILKVNHNQHFYCRENLRSPSLSCSQKPTISRDPESDTLYNPQAVQKT
jgi:hypothetical protein